MDPRADLLRVRDEFLGDPALALTVPQIARLLTIAPAEAEAIVEALEAEGWLVHSPVGVYRRPKPCFA